MTLSLNLWKADYDAESLIELQAQRFARLILFTVLTFSKH
jgi:hypothetical protein